MLGTNLRSIIFVEAIFTLKNFKFSNFLKNFLFPLNLKATETSEKRNIHTFKPVSRRMSNKIARGSKSERSQALPMKPLALTDT